MIMRLGWMVALAVVYFPAASAANAQTFGLGVSTEPHRVTVSTFGLGSTAAFTSAASTQEVVKPDTPPPALSPGVQRVTVVRYARSSWLQSGQAWSVERLRSHLSTGHAVPSAELAGRTLRELSDIHDNLHEGYAWNGGTVTRTFTVQKTVAGSSCPGGVCPTNTYQPRRFFRR